MENISTIIEFPACIKIEAVEVFLRGIKTVDFLFHQTDNLHHKFFVQTSYADDLVSIGYWMANAESEVLERGK